MSASRPGRRTARSGQSLPAGRRCGRCSPGRTGTHGAIQFERRSACCAAPASVRARHACRRVRDGRRNDRWISKKRGSFTAGSRPSICAAAHTAKIIFAGSGQPIQKPPRIWRDWAWISKSPWKRSPLEPDGSGSLEYAGAQYIVLGSPDDFTKTAVGPILADLAGAHPSTGVEEAHFVIELSPIRLKWTAQDGA